MSACCASGGRFEGRMGNGAFRRARRMVGLDLLIRAKAMTEAEIYDGVIMNGTTDFALVVETLRRHEARWCVIGGLAVNTYVEPVYTADLDLVVIADGLEAVLEDLRAADFRMREFPFSVNAQRRAGPAERAASKLMVQFTRPERYQAFVGRAALRPVFGRDVPVAALADVVQGKLWAWGDPARRESKRAKDEGDLRRLGEAYRPLRHRRRRPWLLRRADGIARAPRLRGAVARRRVDAPGRAQAGLPRRPRGPRSEGFRHAAPGDGNRAPAGRWACRATTA